MKKVFLMLATLAASVMGYSTTLDTSLFAKKSVFTVGGYSGATTLTNFPVLVRLQADVPSGFAYVDCQADGSDLRFTDTDGNLLVHEVESWNTSGESFVWVRVPELSGTTTAITAYFGANPASIPAVNGRETWTEYVTVIHGGSAIADSSMNALTLTANAVTATADGGIVGGGLNKPVRKTKGVNIPNPYKNNLFTNNRQYTISFWAKSPVASDTGTHVTMCGVAAWGNAGFLGLFEKGHGWSVAVSSGHHYTEGKGKLSANTWTQTAFSYDTAAGHLISYSNGESIYDANNTHKYTDPGCNYWTLGSYADTASDDSFTGDLDECRIYDGIASADWIKAEYDSAVNASFATGSKVVVVDQTIPSVGFSPVAPGADFINISGELDSFGMDATSGTLKLAIAVHGSSAVVTNDLLSLTETGSFSVNQTGLVSGTDYDIELWVENNLGKKSVKRSQTVYVAPTIELLAPLGAVSGLQQAKFNVGNGDATWTTKTLADSVVNVEVTPGAGMASVEAAENTAGTTPYTNPYTGNPVYWNKNNTTFAYIGEMYMMAGRIYVFGKILDDAGYVKVGSTEVLKHTTYNTFGTGTYSPEASGWYAIDVRAADGSGGKGPSGTLGKDAGGNNLRLGMAYNDENVTTAADAAWKKIMDPGDMSVLRSPLASSYMGMGSLSVEGADAKVWLRFEGVPRAAELYVCYGAVDGGTDLNAWANRRKLVDISAGDTRATLYTAEGVAASACVRFALLMTGSATARGVCQFTGLQSFTQEMPSVALSLVYAGYTNIQYAATLEAFGVGGTEATLTAELAADESFAEILQTKNLGTLTSLSSVPFEFDVLTTNTAYSARVRAVNNVGKSVNSTAVTTTTQTPTLAEIATAVKDITYMSISENVTVSDYGDDSSSAILTLEVASDSAFASIVSVSDPTEIAGVPGLGVAQALVAEGLEGDTAYYVRAKVVNTWGLVTYGEVRAITTRKSVVPVGVGYRYQADGSLVASVAISELYLASATIRLYNGTTLVGEQAVTEAGTWDFGLGVIGAANLKATVETTEDSSEVSVSATPGTACSVVASLADVASARTALVVKAGDKVVLPELAGAAVYANISEPRFATLSDRTLTTQDAGFAAVELYDSNGDLESTGVILIVPSDLPANGRVFIYDETVKKEWSDPTTWRQVGVAENADVPNGTADVAFIPVCGSADLTVTVSGAYSLQDLFIGRLARTARTVRLGGKKNADSALSIYGAGAGKRQRRGTLMVSSVTTDGAIFKLNLGGSDANSFLTVTAARDMNLDCGGPKGANVGPTTTGHYVAINFSNLALTVPQGLTLAMVNGPNRKHGVDMQWQESGNGYTLGADFLRGKGTFRIDMPGLFTDWGNALRSFEGTFVNAIRNNITQTESSRGGSLYSLGMNSSNAAMRLEGFVGAGFVISKSVGTFVEGNTHGYGDSESVPVNIIPARGLEMAGGFLHMMGFKKPEAGFCQRPDGDYEARNITSNLTVDAGLSYIWNGYSPAAGSPIMHFCASNLVQRNYGTIQVVDACTLGNDTTKRCETELQTFAEHYVGYSGVEDHANNVFPIVPWCVTTLYENNAYVLWWPHVDANGMMCRAGSLTNIALADSSSENQNVYSYDKALSISADKTINALNLCSVWKDRYLGAGRTLTVKSGSLIFRGIRSGIGDENGGDKNGALVLPNTGYVYATSTDGNWPNQIWATVTAPHGLVQGYNGLFVLGGDQRGIDERIVFNGGTNYLGAKDGSKGVRIDVPVRVVGGNTKLVVTKANDNTLKGLDLELVTAGGYGPMLEMPAGATEECNKLYVDGVALPRGTYGATGSGAQYVDDARFTGTGVLNVRKDDFKTGLIFILR